ncbi:MAG: uroporphyrinogen decarboxylase family protein [Lachnospiraceae bacterium]
MSKKLGLDAFNLEMSSEVPHTEYSAHFHWKLVNAVTGSDITPDSDVEKQQRATSKFVEDWDYSFMYNTPVDDFIFGEKKSKMGHAVFADGGVDFCNEKKELFQEPEDIYEFDFYEQYGERNPKEIANYFNENCNNQINKYPNCVNTTGTYVTGISGLIEICGWDMLLLAAGQDYKKFGEFMCRYGQWMQQYFEGLALSDVPIVSVHDDIVWTDGPFLPKEWYETYLFPQYKKYFQPLKENGKKILYICDGNYTSLVDDIAQCGVNGFVMEPSTNLQYIADNYGKTHVMIGNADTRTLLLGTKEDIYKEVKRCMDIGKCYPGYIMAVGNHIPSNTPIDNARYYMDAYRAYRKR